MNIIYDYQYEDMNGRKVQTKPIKQLDQARLEAYTIWGVNLILFITIILGHFMRFK